ncbi:OmpA family protein [Sorangium sp. So ce1036]|uniref:OmpA family protein n=1 Tax=Sorangium sp. So ce1036 TaxID=3133328 RepID=UPI003F0D79E2
MRRYVASVLCAVMMVGTAAATAGCTAHASFNAGGEAAKAPPPPPPAPEPAPEPKEEKPRRRFKLTFKLKGNQVELPGPVVFETASDKLAPESDEVLGIVDDFLNQRKDVSLLRIEGHTDSDGEDALNQTLSEKRAMSVARWLVAKGHDCKRFIAVGFGESKPVADNNTPEGKAQNRRTGFFIAAINGKAVDGAPVDAGGKVAGDPCK